MVDASRPLTQAIRDIGADRWPWVREGLADKAAAAMPMQFAAHVGTTAATVSTGQTGRAAAEKPSNRPNRTSRDHEDQPISSERGISSGLLQLAASGTNLRQTPEGHFELASMFDSEPVPMLDNRGQPVIGASGKPVMIPRLADPRFFVDRGLEGRDALENPSPFLMGLLAVIADLVNFRHNHAWDLQRRIGDNVPKLVDGATVAIGLYGAAAGIPEDVLLAIQDRCAQIRSHFPEGTVMDERYPHLPKRNVENTHIGYELYQSGRIGPSPSRNGL